MTCAIIVAYRIDKLVFGRPLADTDLQEPIRCGKPATTDVNGIPVCEHHRVLLRRNPDATKSQAKP